MFFINEKIAEIFMNGNRLLIPQNISAISFFFLSINWHWNLFEIASHNSLHHVRRDLFHYIDWQYINW